MWEAIGEVFTSGNGAAIAILITIIVILLVFGAKRGLFSIHTDIISVGEEASETERTIMRHQIDFAKQACGAFENQIRKTENYNDYLGKYIIELCFDEIINWIAFNHIECTKTYVALKQDTIWNIVQSHTENPAMKSPQFKKQTDAHIRYIIQRLVDIRNEYK
jgi:hypothetical protein